ncbi:hypothetical protein P8C59_001095 [Phyllachora maydis]|uniref:Response regulatory domain-containing protein n=1 Tax=Phyllachora maydis TaxID=1825666 RepID=A0AAD9HYL7_9PEZI|nr:hypothetical protein P8C59_001095 [Phyllachora maydis]
MTSVMGEIGPRNRDSLIWVRRPGASATLVTVLEDDLVDDVREMILRKYGNSLGRQFDAPDLTLRIVPREPQRQERTLGPEEPMGRTLDAYFPGGQMVEEALVIQVPLRRSPRPSPRIGPPHVPHVPTGFYEDGRPADGGLDYFGPGAVAQVPVTVTATSSGAGPLPHPPSVLNTGQVPQIPSPGGGTRRPYKERPDRPRLGRQHTSSPTILNMVNGSAATHGPAGVNTTPQNRTQNMAHASNPPPEHIHPASPTSSAAPPAPPPIPTPPATTDPGPMAAAVPSAAPAAVTRSTTPPPPPAPVASPRPANLASRPKRVKNDTAGPSPSPRPGRSAGMPNGSVPPINVLIVEDNIINLKLLEAFVKRLKVRWQTAMNGREAVNKWRAGGFHLVLMDIQLPVMSGLEATREIRRLERVNSIGAISSSAPSAGEANETELAEDNLLKNTDMFKSPVIIVALTASALQSDRHEALAAGCNDFLTKPVNFVWLERKVMEWGCMQALIDFDGWRKWKDYSQQADQTEPKKAANPSKAKAKKARLSSSS